MQEIEGSTPAPQTVANGRAPPDRPRTAAGRRKPDRLCGVTCANYRSP